MRRSTRTGLAVILTSFFLPLIALMFTESIAGSLVIRTGSISRRATFEQFPIGRDPHQELGVVLVPVAGDTLVLDKELPKDEAARVAREFSRSREDGPPKGEVYVFKGWIDEARHAMPYRYIVAASLTLLLVGLLIILLAGSRETVPALPKVAVPSRGEPEEDD